MSNFRSLVSSGLGGSASGIGNDRYGASDLSISLIQDVVLCAASAVPHTTTASRISTVKKVPCLVRQLEARAAEPHIDHDERVLRRRTARKARKQWLVRRDAALLAGSSQSLPLTQIMCSDDSVTVIKMFGKPNWTVF